RAPPRAPPPPADVPARRARRDPRREGAPAETTGGGLNGAATVAPPSIGSGRSPPVRSKTTRPRGRLGRKPKEAHMAIIELGTDTREALPEPEAGWFVDATATEPDATARGQAHAALTDRLSGRWALFLTVAWFTIFTIGVALEPA